MASKTNEIGILHNGSFPKGGLLAGFLFLFSLVIFTQNISAETNSLSAKIRTAPRIGIHSTPLYPERLPSPGEPFYILFELSNAHDVPKNARALLTIDGKLTEVHVLDGYLNKRDKPEYKVLAYAPVVELSYQLIVQDFDDVSFTSSRFSVRRNCVPDLTLTDLNIDWRVQGNEHLTISIERANALERELKAYDRTLELINELEILMEQ